METTNEIAARWAVRRDAGALSPVEAAQLEAWLLADSRHRGAYVRACAQWADLDRLAALNGPAQPAVERRGSSRRYLLAASIAVLAVGAGVSWLALRESGERYATAIGEVRRIPLRDGSTLLLNTASEVLVQLSAGERDIRLVRGEALFEVAHDKSRPFIVHASDTAVRAVGTAFAVRLEAAQVDVTVTEGVVELSERPVAGPSETFAPRAAGRRVKANERAVIARAREPEVAAIAGTAVDRQLAWRQGMVSFDGEPLQVAVGEINRHNRRQIVIDDPQLANRPVVGVFRATDVDGFSAAAAATLNARAVRDGDVIRLEPVAVESKL